MKIARKILAKLPVISAVAVSALAPVANAVAENAANVGSSSLAPLGAGLAIGMAVVDAVRAYERTSGAVWAGA
jgi:hypothetical protein